MPSSRRREYHFHAHRTTNLTHTTLPISRILVLIHAPDEGGPALPVFTHTKKSRCRTQREVSSAQWPMPMPPSTGMTAPVT